MPSITKAKLDELTDEIEAAKAGKDSLRQRAELAEAKVRQFDGILDKIKRASRGQPLSTVRNSGNFASYNDGYISGEPLRKVKIEERQAQEIASLNERIVVLESRLAVVTAVAEFAQEHKA